MINIVFHFRGLRKEMAIIYHLCPIFVSSFTLPFGSLWISGADYEVKAHNWTIMDTIHYSN